MIISDAIDKELLGVFANSFYLTNYELTLKTDPATRDPSILEPSKDDDFDVRTRKYTKRI